MVFTNDFTIMLPSNMCVGCVCVCVCVHRVGWHVSMGISGTQTHYIHSSTMLPCVDFCVECAHCSISVATLCALYQRPHLILESSRLPYTASPQTSV